MLTTNTEGRVVRWIRFGVGVVTTAIAFIAGSVFGVVTSPAPTTTLQATTDSLRDATLQATTDSLRDARTECKELAYLTYNLTTGLESWMRFAHEDHSLESAD